MLHQENSCLLHRNVKEGVISCPALLQMGLPINRARVSLVLPELQDAEGRTVLPLPPSKHSNLGEAQTPLFIHIPVFLPASPIQGYQPTLFAASSTTGGWGCRYTHLLADHPAWLQSYLAKSSDSLILGHTCSLVHT